MKRAGAILISQCLPELHSEYGTLVVVVLVVIVVVHCSSNSGRCVVRLQLIVGCGRVLRFAWQAERVTRESQGHQQKQYNKMMLVATLIVWTDTLF